MLQFDSKSGKLKIYGASEDLAIEWVIITERVHTILAQTVGHEMANMLLTQGLFTAVAKSEGQMESEDADDDV